MSDYLLAALLAWAFAQVSKFVIDGIRKRSFDFKKLRASGGMPSVHSALMASVTTVIGVKDGLESPIFALAIVLSVIVLYDALNVRRAVGEQGRVLQLLQKKLSFKRADGHTPIQVLIGVIVGILVAITVLSF